MKVLIIYAHPRKDSFNQAILKRVEGVLAELQQDVIIRDLYAMNFDPVFRAEEQAKLQKNRTPATIKTEQKHISWADMLIIIHPIWWFSMPAILKGYIDKVLQAGFAYSYVNGKVIGLLQNKKLLLINTTGTPEKAMEQKGIKDVLQTTMDTGIYEFCGLKVEHIFLAGVSYIDEKAREAYLDQVESHLWQEFK
ncbi:MAG: NAD(P)H-dependent oxidoreductase [Candidatus Cloacimonetes bacterium]|nr:NAD(P)H-dependent oxidoreductase [Candidatus Cloacimonadota bacterium]